MNLDEAVNQARSELEHLIQARANEIVAEHERVAHEALRRVELEEEIRVAQEALTAKREELANLGVAQG